MKTTIDVPLEALVRVRELHARVDESSTRIAGLLGERLRCARGCHACCVDDLSVSRVEAAAIVDAFPHVLDSAPREPGACAMLDDDGACRVYAARPYVCRTQGLPLRWVEIEGEEALEHRDICPLNDPPASSGEASPLEEMPADRCWTIGRAETALAAIDRIASGGREPDRVRLRDLFAECAHADQRDLPSEHAFDGAPEKRS